MSTKSRLVLPAFFTTPLRGSTRALEQSPFFSARIRMCILVEGPHRDGLDFLPEEAMLAVSCVKTAVLRWGRGGIVLSNEPITHTRRERRSLGIHAI